MVAKYVVVGLGAWLALALACGGTSSPRAPMAAPSVMEESPDLGSGDDVPSGGQEPTEPIMTAEPAPSEPAPSGTDSAPSPSDGPRLTPTQIDDIKALLIQASVDAYDGSCPCPYSEASDGSRCGGRSAYSRAGGEEPLCYPDDISDEMVYEFWASQQ